MTLASIKKTWKFYVLLLVFLLIFVSSIPVIHAAQNCFGIGTPKATVLRIMGKPTTANTYSSLNEEIWYYGFSSITFKDGKVYEYDNISGNLKVWLGSKKLNSSPFKIGSTKQDVLNAMGTPTSVNVYSSLNEEIWRYGFSLITFKDGKVYEYDNISGNLKVNVGIKTSSKSLVKIGSTKTDVIKSLGTPSSISKFSSLGTEIWYYGFSSITFKDNVVYSWNDFGDLKTHVSSINLYKGVEENINYSEIYPFAFEVKSSSASLSKISKLSASQKKIATIYDIKGTPFPFFAENGSYYGQISELTGRPKTVYVRGYYRKDGTYVRSHYRSKPIGP